jgi:hypothetical protein
MYNDSQTEGDERNVYLNSSTLIIKKRKHLNNKRFLAVDCSTATITSSATPIYVCNTHEVDALITTFPYPAGLFTYDTACFSSGVVTSAIFKTG